MAWHRTSDKALDRAIRTQFIDTYMRHMVSIRCGIACSTLKRKSSPLVAPEVDTISDEHFESKELCTHHVIVPTPWHFSNNIPAVVNTISPLDLPFFFYRDKRKHQSVSLTICAENLFYGQSHCTRSQQCGKWYHFSHVFLWNIMFVSHRHAKPIIWDFLGQAGYI